MAPKSGKELRIVFSDDTKSPTYTFTGVWTGFEVSTVASNLRRAYLRVKRDQRRAVPSEPSITLTKEES